MENSNKLVVVITHGMDDEKASVAWSIANGGIKNGLEVTVFLASAAVDFARKRGADKVRLNPEDPTIGEMMQFVVENGAGIYVCPPCIKVRGYEESDLIDGVVVMGSAAIHDRIKEGAATLTF